jgi:hypothetical protein
MKQQLFKVLAPGRKAIYGTGSWPAPGVWRKRIERLKSCQSGYHLCTRSGLVEWLGPEIWLAEQEGEYIWKDKRKVIVASRARLIRKFDTWNERTARLFACDCAERVFHLAKDEREAIRVARAFANGEATQEQLAAAKDATRDATRAAAWAAAWNAAWDAAKDAAWNAAKDAERKWQSRRLFQYLEGKRT